MSFHRDVFVGESRGPAVRGRRRTTAGDLSPSEHAPMRRVDAVAKTVASAARRPEEYRGLIRSPKTASEGRTSQFHVRKCPNCQVTRELRSRNPMFRRLDTR